MMAIRIIIGLFFLNLSSWVNAQENNGNALSSSTEILLNQRFEKLDSLLKVNASDRELIRGYNDLAWVYLNREGNYIDAEKYNALADSLSTLIRDTSLMAESQTIKGRIFNRKGYFASALETQKHAYELKAASRDTSRMSYSMNLIAKVFVSQNKHEEALAFYMRALKLKEAINVDKESYLSFKAISYCHLNLGHYEDARIYGNKTFPLVKDGSRRSGKSYQLIAEIDLLERKLDSALVSSRKAEKYLLKNGSNLEIAQAQIILGRVLLALNFIEKAREKTQSALLLSKKEDHPILIIESLEILQSISTKKREYQKALELTQDIQLAKDSFYSKEDLTKSMDFETLYRVKEKEKQIAELETATKENLREIAVKEKKRGMLSVFLFASFLFLSALVWFQYYKNKKDKVIAQKDHTIQDQKIKELEHEQKTIRLQSMIEGQEKERLRLSQDIHDSLGGLLSTAKTYLSGKNGSDSNIKNIIDQSCEEVREITNNLMPVSLKVVGLSGAIEDLATRAEILGIECKTEIHNLNIENEDSRLAIYRIVQELVNNVIKHASANNLLIQLIQSDQELHILIEDDGKGFKIPNDSKGRGLKNISSRVELLSGKIEIESLPDRGTSIAIDILIPINKIST